MTTKKDTSLSFKDKNTGFSSSSASDKFKNLNLNSYACNNEKSVGLNFSSYKLHNKRTEVYTGSNHKSNLNNPGSTKFANSRYGRIDYLTSHHEKNDTKSKQGNGSGNSETSKNSSTLSLAIAGYIDPEEAKLKALELGKQTEKNQKSVPVAPVKELDMMPRQQNDGETAYSTPQVMKFQSSRKLLNLKTDPPRIPTEFERRILFANKCFKLRLYHVSEDLYSEMLSSVKMTSHEAAVVHANRATIYLTAPTIFKRSYKGAKKDAEMAIRLSPEWWKGYYLLGYYYLELELWEDAKLQLSKAYSLKPSSIVIEALNIVQNGVFLYSLNPQQRRIYHQMENRYCYRNVQTFFHSDNSSDEEEWEVKRSKEDEQFLDDQEPFEQFAGASDPNISLLSDGQSSNILAHSFEKGGMINNDSEAPIITLDSSTESIVREEREKSPFVKIDTIDTTSLLKMLYGYDNSHEGFSVLSEAPHFPPTEKGIYACLLNADHVSNVKDLRNDGIGPWNNGKVKYSIDKIGLFEKDGTYEAVTRNVAGANNVARLCRITHPSLKIKKRVYWAVNPEDLNSLVPGTFILIVYEVEETFTITDEQKISNQRLTKAASAKLDNVIVGRTAKEANAKFYENGGLINNDRYNLPSISQIRNKMARSDFWQPTTKRGRPILDDLEEFRRLIDERFIVRAYYVGNDISEERIMLATPAHMYLLKNVLMKRKVVQKFFDLTQELLQYPKNERMARAKELIESKFFKENEESAACFCDVTFNLSPSFHVSMLLCSCQHIRNEKGRPFVFIPAVMLSKTHKKADFEWFGKELEKQIGEDVSARCYMTDSERSLEGLLECKAFRFPCIKLNCNIHNKQNFADYCNNDPQIMKEIFGTNEGSIHITGLIDEMIFEDFYDKITVLGTSERWSKYEKLQNFVSSEPRLRYFFERNNLMARIAGGFGFKQATDNYGECQNMLIKARLRFKDNMPIQNLIKEFQNVMVEQLADISRVYVHKSPCQLYDQSKFLGSAEWSMLSEDKIRELLKDIHIINSDILPGFESRASSFPALLAANTSEDQRRDMVLTARTYKVIQDEPGSFIIVKGDDLKKIDTNTVPVICKCRMANSKQAICHHILAVEQQFPTSKVLEKIQTYLESETAPQRNARLNGPSDGAKPGQHRRRRGNDNSRNAKNDKISTYLDLNNDFPASSSEAGINGPPKKRRKNAAKDKESEAEIICLTSSSNLQKNRLPQIPTSHSVNTVNRSGNPQFVQSISCGSSSSKTHSQISRIIGPRVFLPRQRVDTQRPIIIRPENISGAPTLTRPPLRHPHGIPSRPLLSRSHQDTVNAPPISSALAPNVPIINETTMKRIIDFSQNAFYYLTHSEVQLPDYLSYQPFIVTKISKLSGWQNRKCAHIECKAPLGDDPNNIVISHVEPYTYLDQTGAAKRTVGARAICSSMICMNRRYPFITKDCFTFTTEITPSEADNVLKSIVRKT